MVKRMWGWLGSIAVAYLIVVALVWVFQDRLVFFPDLGRDDLATPQTMGLAFDDVQLSTEDGATLAAWWVPRADARGTVVLFHGNAGSIASRIPYAAMFHKLGYATLLVEYRGYGRSTGTPSEAGTYRDAEAAWRYLTETRKLKPERIVVMGESLGGGVATWLAAKYKPGALILASSFTSLIDVGADVYWFLPVRLIGRTRYDSLSRMTDIDCPVLVAHSQEDEIIPVSHGQALFLAAPDPKLFVKLAGGHNDGFLYVRPEWAEVVGVFLDGVLQR
ncbi:MAG: alpha/beta hydrolase [Burkholderiales bacterium]